MTTLAHPSDTPPVGTRRLVAVVYADVVGYSRLIGLDDAGTIRRFRLLRRALIGPAIQEHGGRIVQTGGDSLLVAFESIAEAVRCAVHVQQQLPLYDGDQAPDRRIRFRIGINLGDAIPQATDLHGEVVNIAARLQAACPPGGICLSRAVHEHVRGLPGLSFTPLGALALKNIGHPIEAFVLQPSGAASSRGHRRWVRFALGAAAMSLLVLAGAGGWRHYGTPAATPAAAGYVPADVGLANAPRLSIAVLPFENFEGNAAQDYLVDGFTEDLTTALARYTDLLVIARSSAFTYKGKPHDVRRIGDELGVRYLLEGSVRQAGPALRVNAQLVSTESGNHIWAEQFDTEPGVIGMGQDDVIQRIVGTMNSRLLDTESVRGQHDRPSNPDALDLYLQARAARQMSDAKLLPQIVALCERALALDPTLVRAMTLEAGALVDMAFDAGDPSYAERVDRAEVLVAQAKAIAPDDANLLSSEGFLLRLEGRLAEAVALTQRAVQLYPNRTDIENNFAQCLIELGRSAEAVPHIERAIRLNPRGLNSYLAYRRMGEAMALLGRYEDSAVWLQRSIDTNVSASSEYRADRYVWLAAVQELLGRHDAAQAAVDQVTRLSPWMTIRGFGDEHDMSVLAAQLSPLIVALHKTTLRDHADEDADFGLPSDNALSSHSFGRTPLTVPGARTIRTDKLAALLASGKPLVLQAALTWRSIPGAVVLAGAGAGAAGTLADAVQQRLQREMTELTQGNHGTPVVAMDFNSECFSGRNLALRLAALGYTEVYWYRGGQEAWEVAGLPEALPTNQPW